MAWLKWCRILRNYLMGPYSSKVLELSKSNKKSPIKKCTLFSWRKEWRVRNPTTYNDKKQGAQISQAQTQDKNWIECGHEHLSPVLALSPRFLGILFCDANIFLNWDTFPFLMPVCKFFQSLLFLQFTAVFSRCAYCIPLLKEKYPWNQDHSKAQYIDYILLLKL